MTTVTHPALSVPRLCNDCGGLGCDDCYGTGTSEGSEERMTDIDPIRERHVRAPDVDEPICLFDWMDWPCDTRQHNILTSSLPSPMSEDGAKDPPEPAQISTLRGSEDE